MLTRREWKAVIDFAHAVNASLTTSFAISEGVQDAAGVWTPDQARKLLANTKDASINNCYDEFGWFLGLME